MTLPEAKALVRSCGLPYEQAISAYQHDFTQIAEEEKDWLCNLENKVSTLKGDAAEQVQRVITKLKTGSPFAAGDSADLSRFVSSINTIVEIVNWLNNFVEGAPLSDGSTLHLPTLFNQFRQAERLADCSVVLNKKLQAFLPHLFSVVKHCQDPVRYPIFYKYWRNIVREAFEQSDDYDSLTAFYRTLPEPNRHLHFGAYLGAVGTAVAQKVTQQVPPSTMSTKADQYLRERVLNLEKYQQLLSVPPSPVPPTPAAAPAVANSAAPNPAPAKPISHPLNQILFGPPGTGKTYQTQRIAFEIIRGHAPADDDEARTFFKAQLYDQIELVTFHQSFTYEDFVQGIRPTTSNSGALAFAKHNGVFYDLAQRARSNWERSHQQGSTHVPFDTVFEDFILPLREEENLISLAMQLPGYSFTLTRLNNDNLRFVKNGKKLPLPPHSIHLGGREGVTFASVGRHRLNLETLKKLYEQGYANGSNLGLMSYYKPLVEALHARASAMHLPAEPPKRYVLVIDEINRANISRVFGELITLLEPDKRLGGSNELTVRLPSGEKDFGIPPNLYLIGTMNTADKSIALLDIALRRRFDFEALYPLYQVHGKPVPHAALLEALNEQIVQHKSRDFQIGHAYFLEDKPLAEIMNRKVIPLLYEYFLNDETKIKRLLTAANIHHGVHPVTGLINYQTVDTP